MILFGSSGRRRASRHERIQSWLLLAVLVFGLSVLAWMLFK